MLRRLMTLVSVLLQLVPSLSVSYFPVAGVYV